MRTKGLNPFHVVVSQGICGVLQSWIEQSWFQSLFLPLLFCVEGLSSKERWWRFSANLPCPWLCSRVGESRPKIPRLCSQHRGQIQLSLPHPVRDLSTWVEAVILHSGCSIIHAKTLSQAYGERLVIVLPHSALSSPPPLCSSLCVLLNPYASGCFVVDLWGACMNHPFNALPGRMITFDC